MVCLSTLSTIITSGLFKCETTEWGFRGRTDITEIAGKIKIYFKQTRVGDYWNSEKTNQDQFLTVLNYNYKITVSVDEV